MTPPFDPRAPHPIARAETPQVVLRGSAAAVLHDLWSLRFPGIYAVLTLIFAASTQLGFATFLLFPALCLLELLVFRRTVTSLAFGADGVALRSYGFWRAFIRHAQLSHFDVQRDQKDNWFLRLLKTDGSATLLAYSRDPGLVMAWKAHIDHAMYLARKPSARIRVRELGRGNDDRTTWLERLKAVKVDRGSYRSHTLTEDDLRLALEDPTCPADERWAAALVLRRANPTSKVRIAEVAKEVARPEFREALDALAEEEALDDERAAEWADRVRPPRA